METHVYTNLGVGHQPGSAILDAPDILISATALARPGTMLSDEEIRDLQFGASTLSRPYLIQDESGALDGYQALIQPLNADEVAINYDDVTTLLADSDVASQYTHDTEVTNASSAASLTRLPPCYASLRVAPIALFYGLAVGLVGPVVTELVKTRVRQLFVFHLRTSFRPGLHIKQIVDVFTL